MKKSFDEKELMALAVKAMTDSVPEVRRDGKASPLVGAVLWKSNGTTEIACRGELRDGDHAEFTLLERKNRSSRLDDAVLFSTLEPCAPGARRHPKLSCAERIVLARIKEVWVGVEDPDPTVDRKGIKYLQDNGVKVHMFERELQERIRECNKEFIEQATERALAALELTESKPSLLSEFEEPLGMKISDLETDALEAYRKRAGIEERVESDDFRRRLTLQGLVCQEGKEFIPTGFGLILFGREPRFRLGQAGLLATVHYSNGVEETHDFDGPAVNIPEQAIQWLRNKIPNPISRTEAVRTEVNEVLYELLREGIVNALVHRDYSIEGAKCQLQVYPNHVVIMSPGLPVSPITFEQLKSFEAPMLSRNPLMHFVFAKMKLAEERGLGLKSIKSRASESNLPIPSYSYAAPYLKLTVFLNAGGAIAAIGEGLVEKLSTAEHAGWEWVVTQESVSTAEYEHALQLPNRTAKNHLKKLTDIGLLRKVGAGRATRYEIVRE